MKLPATVGFLYKVAHKIGRFSTFNLAQGIEFKSVTAWSILKKKGTLVHHVHGKKNGLGFLYFAQRISHDGFSKSKGVKLSPNFERS